MCSHLSNKDNSYSFKIIDFHQFTEENKYCKSFQNLF